MQKVDITFSEYIITDNTPNVLRFNDTSVVLILIERCHKIDIKKFIAKLMTTMKCFLFSLKKRINGSFVTYELTVYKIKCVNKSWGYWGAQHDARVIEVSNPWKYWQHYEKEQALDLRKIAW